MSITLQNVIISFPSLFKPKQFKNRAGQPEGDPRFEAQFLIPPTHPQYEAIQIEKQNAITASTIFDGEIPEDCNDAVVFYADAFSKSSTYDSALDDWIVVKGSAKENDRPAVVDMSRQEVLDPGACFPGQLVNANINIVCYAGGKGGLGAFLNGVMLTDETGELGRLDSKPTVDQMFGDVSDAPAKKSMTKPSDKAGSPAPKPPGKAAPKPPSKPKHVMTDEAENTYEEYIDAGWTDVDLIEAGLMEGPPTSF